VIDPPYLIAAGVWRTENCDLGDAARGGWNLDTGPDRSSACSTTCSVRGTHLWDCHTDAVTKVSTCYYLCGNNWLDLVGGTPVSGYAGGSSYIVGGGLSVNEPCDLFTQPYTAQTKAGTPNGYVNYNATWTNNYIILLSQLQNLGCT